MSTTDDSSSSMDDEQLLSGVSYPRQHANRASLIFLGRQREEDGLAYSLSGSGPSTRTRRMFIRPLLVFMIGFCYLQRRSGVDHKDQRQQQQPELEKDSSYWWSSSLSSSSSSASSSNLEFHFGNETHENDASSVDPTSSESTSDHKSSKKGPAIVPSTSHMSQHAFHPPYFPRHVSASQSSSPDSDETDSETFGWEPGQYPNPRENPQKCGIAYLLQDEQFAQPDDTDNSLQLCDPDWVLGGIYLEEIAVAMKSFVQTYSSPPPFAVPPPPVRRNRMLQQDDDGWEVEDAEYLENTPEMDPDEDESSADENLPNHAANLVASEAADALAGPSAPFVELGIATVRKVRLQQTASRHQLRLLLLC